MRAPFVAVLFLLHLTPALVHSNEPTVSDNVATSNGLAVQILFAGADYANNRLTLSARIENTDARAAYLALVGPEPRAVDSAGGVYAVRRLSGIATCRSLRDPMIDHCIRNTRKYLPGTKFTRIPPGASTLLNVEMSTHKIAKDVRIAFTMNVALGRGTRPADNRSNDPELEYINVHLPLIALK